jgi:hypothetical protein
MSLEGILVGYTLLLIRDSKRKHSVCELLTHPHSLNLRQPNTYDTFNLFPGPFFWLAYENLRPFPRYARDSLFKTVRPDLNSLQV